MIHESSKGFAPKSDSPVIQTVKKEEVPVMEEAAEVKEIEEEASAVEEAAEVKEIEEEAPAVEEALEVKEAEESSEENTEGKK